jgi:hypothetical protein
MIELTSRWNEGTVEGQEEGAFGHDEGGPEHATHCSAMAIHRATA